MDRTGRFQDIRIEDAPKNEGELDVPNFSKMKKASTSGSNGKRGATKIKLTKEEFKSIITKVAILIATAVVTICVLGNLAFGKIKDDMIINNAASNVHYTIIAPETHRTSNNEGYFYDYSDIYRKLVEEYGEDIGLYLFYEATDSKHQLERMVEEGMRGYYGLDNYLSKHGYSSFDEWKKDMRERTILEFEDQKLHERMSELDDKHAVENDLDKFDNDGTLGGTHR